MAARVEGGRARLLTQTGLDWTDKYPSVIAELSKVSAKAYLAGELCRVGDNGLPSFAQVRAASDGARGVRLVYCALPWLTVAQNLIVPQSTPRGTILRSLWRCSGPR